MFLKYLVYSLNIVPLWKYPQALYIMYYVLVRDESGSAVNRKGSFLYIFPCYSDFLVSLQ